LAKLKRFTVLIRWVAHVNVNELYKICQFWQLLVHNFFNKFNS